MEQAKRTNNRRHIQDPDDQTRQRPSSDGEVSLPASETVLLAWRAARLTAVLNVMRDGVLVCDPSGHILDANPAARARFTLRGRSDGTGQARYDDLATLLVIAQRQMERQVREAPDALLPSPWAELPMPPEDINSHSVRALCVRGL